jgi:hypothetical protein
VKTGGSEMDAYSQAHVLRVQCKHIRTLAYQLISELATIEHELNRGRAAVECVAMHGDTLDVRCERIVNESLRLQALALSMQ